MVGKQLKMVVYKRGKSGIYTVDFEANGQRVKRSAGTTSKREALEIERELRAELKARHRRLGVRPSMSLDDAIDRYLTTVIKPKSKPRAAETYIYYLCLIREHFGGATMPDKITAADMADWRDKLLAEVKPGTVRRYLAVLSGASAKSV